MQDPDQDPAVWSAIETRAFVSVPFIREGNLTASIYVNFKEPHRWTRAEIALIQEVGSRTWEAVERARAEERLRASETKFQAIADSVDHMIWSTRPDGSMTISTSDGTNSPVFLRGSTDGEAWAGMFHPDDQIGPGRHGATRSKQARPIGSNIACGTGPVSIAGFSGEPSAFATSPGRSRAGSAPATDIHDQVEARELLAKSREELEREVQRRTEDRDRVWRLSSDLMLVARFDSTITAVNPAWTILLGWDERDLVGRPFMDLIHPDDVATTVAEARRLSEGHTTLRFENRYQHKDGSYRWLSWTAVPDATFIHAVARDVTELHQAQEALRQSQKMEAVGQLTGGVAHDFNNLLTVIKSSTDLLLGPDSRGSPQAVCRRHRRHGGSRREADVTAAAFARRQALKPEVFDAGHRISSIADMLRTIVGSRVGITFEIARPDCFVEADASQFETAIVNMVVNARDAMGGEGTLRIRVDRQESMPTNRGPSTGQGLFVVVSLTDTGHGIAHDKIGQIFEPFFTTKEVGKGTGLGLSQVYGFAKQSGGDVTVKASLAAVRRSRSSCRKRRSAAPARPVEEIGLAAPELGRGRRILVVEDNIDVGHFSTQILKDLGYETTLGSQRRRRACALAETNGYDAVFSDVVMPGMSGIELGQTIRKLYPGLPVVLTSGYSHVLAEEGRHGFELLQKRMRLRHSRGF